MVVVPERLPRSRGRRGRAGAGRPATWRSSRSTGGARAAGPARRARPAAGRPRAPTPPTPCRPGGRQGAGWWCSRRSRRRPRGWPRAAARPPPAGCRPRPRRSWCRACSSGSRSGCRPRSWRAGSAWTSSQVHSCGVATSPSIFSRQSARSIRGVGPAVRTGNPRSAYWPGGSLVACSAGRRRPLNPRDTNPPIGTSLRCAFSTGSVAYGHGRAACAAGVRRSRGDRREPARGVPGRGGRARGAPPGDRHRPRLQRDGVRRRPVVGRRCGSSPRPASCRSPAIRWSGRAGCWPGSGPPWPCCGRPPARSRPSSTTTG